MKKSQRKYQAVTRIVHEPDYDHPAWLDPEGATPTPDTHPGAFDVLRVPVESDKPRRARARSSKVQDLSKSQIRRRLSAAGLRGEALSRAVRDLKNRPANSFETEDNRYALGWPVTALINHFGKRLVRALLRNVHVMFVVLDEFGYYASPGWADIVQSYRCCRKYNVRLIEASQLVPGDGTLASALATVGAP